MDNSNYIINILVTREMWKMKNHENLSEIEQAYCYNDVQALRECIRNKRKNDTLTTIKNCIIMFIGSLIFWGIFYILVLIVYC